MTVEEKAEEYTNKNDTIVMGFEENLDCTDQMQQAFIDGYHEGFKDCAKSRLNVTTISDCPIKDEWHYVKDGDLPSDKHGHVVINQDWDKVTVRNGRFEFLDGCKADVIAWKEIVPPKESK